MKSRSNKGRGRPGPDAVIKQHIFELERSLKLEQKFMANASAVEQATGEDAFVGRDVAARKLRFLKTWFELPSEAFITCLNLLDRFLTKLKVKSAHLDCAAISCFHIAAGLHKKLINAADLVTISQVKCTVSDLERMSDIVRTKLGLADGEKPVTAVHYVEHFVKILECEAKQQSFKATILQRKSLLTRLEVVMLDSRCVAIRPSAVALALVQAEMGRLLQPDGPKSPYYSVEFVKQLWLYTCKLQNICMITPNQMLTCHATMKSILQNYDNNARNMQRKRMKMRCSIRWNSLKPSENFSTHLCVIRE